MVEDQGTDRYFRQALEELEIEFVDDCRDLDYLIGRACALYEENKK